MKIIHGCVNYLFLKNTRTGALFPSWLPGAFAVMFAKPFPEVSQLNTNIYFHILLLKNQVIVFIAYECMGNKNGRYLVSALSLSFLN